MSESDPTLHSYPREYETLNFPLMHKRDLQLIEDPDTNSRLSLAILLAYGIVITGFLAFVGVIYVFSQMIS